MTVLDAARRWKYVILTYRDYADCLKRQCAVETALLRAAKSGLTGEQCRALALKLGLPTWMQRDE